eukprot:scaffold6454_cov267-Chaetoceros_neogracile.AAC.10
MNNERGSDSTGTDEMKSSLDNDGNAVNKDPVKIICEGDTKDFGVAGNGIVDCFKQTFSTSGQCKDIPVTIKYKIINPNMGEGSNFDMKLEFFTMIRTLQMMEPDRSPTTP